MRKATASPPAVGFGLLLFGFLIPLATFVIELSSHMCADTFFDPMPTFLHMFLVAGVPTVNLLTWYACRTGTSSIRPTLLWLNGIAIGVSLLYTVLFLPVLPVAVIGLLFFGMGVLPMAPLFSFVSALFLRAQLHRVRDERPLAVAPSSLSLWCGGSLGILVLGACEVPETITNSYLKSAAYAQTPADRTAAVQKLRSYGSRDVMLAACYDDGRRSPFFNSGGPVATDKARELYYRVTGAPFNSAPRPRSSSTTRHARFQDEWVFDPDVGGESVSGRISGLKLVSSRIDGFIDPDGAVSYSEWKMRFSNSSNLAREARTQILLPPGGVVSRLTLWVNGEEREAAFAGRAKVREAYRQVVVVQRRDPVLVTTSGKDRVLVQCFPVPVQGEMKIRIGITAPLTVDIPEEALFQLPSIAERNFTIEPQSRHDVSIKSAADMLLPGTDWEKTTKENAVHASGVLSDLQLRGPTAVIRAVRNKNVITTWGPDSRAPDGDVTKQTLKTLLASTPTHVVFVVDGSQGMATAAASVAEVLKNAAMSHTVLLAGDELHEIGPLSAEDCSGADAVSDFNFEGGMDNHAALIRAWTLAGARPGAAIVWLHGPQPLLLGTVSMPAVPNMPSIYDLQLFPGPNKVLERLEADGISSVHTVPHLGTLAESLQRLFKTWNAERHQLVRERVSPEKVQGLPRHSDHITRLWAAEEVASLAAKAATESQAVKMAARYQLVTSVSGAVVLETKEQFERAGLEPVDGSTVPTVPEPEEWALIAIAAGALICMLRRRRVWKAA